MIAIALQRLNQIEKKLKWIDEVFGVQEQTTWHPFPDSPQLLAYHSPADELLYGGEPGGG